MDTPSRGMCPKGLNILLDFIYRSSNVYWAGTQTAFRRLSRGPCHLKRAQSENEDEGEVDVDISVIQLSNPVLAQDFDILYYFVQYVTPRDA